MVTGYVAVGTQFLGGPEDTDADHASSLAEPLGPEATLLAVVPVPGTGTSLAIVGYIISASAEPGATRPYNLGEPTGTTTLAAPPGQPRNPGQPGHPGQLPAGLNLDYPQRRVWADGREITLTFREYELLAFLSAHPATVFTRAELVERVWRRVPAENGNHEAIAQDTRTVDVHVSRVRRKLGPRHGRSLVTEYRVGYQFRPAQ